MSAPQKALRVGTRGSLLARTQTGRVVDQIAAAHPHLQITTEIIQTTGDMRRDVPFSAVGTKGMFVKEIEQALLDSRIDVGVHSLKDMPSELPEGLEIACVPVREDTRDALVSRQGLGLQDLPKNAVVGTSSVRRQAQLQLFRQDLKVIELRGNLDTRLRKLDDGEYDAIVLAAAGLRRLGMGDRITELLSVDVCVPAAGQGTLAIETRIGDHATMDLLASIHDARTALCVAAERAFLAGLGGGCSVPAGAFASIVGDTDIEISAILLTPDGGSAVRHHDRSNLGGDPMETALAVGRKAAHEILKADLHGNRKG